MNKLRPGRVVCACIIAFSLASVSSSAAEVVVDNSGKYSNQDTHIHSMETGTKPVKFNGTDFLARGLQNKVLVISCGLIGLFLLRMANKR